MENAPIMTLNGISCYPGTPSKVWEKFFKWALEVYMPLEMRVPQRRQIDLYQIVHDTPLFPSLLVLFHYEKHADWENARKSREAKFITSEFDKWTKEGITDYTWSAVYELVKGYRSDRSVSEEHTDTRIKNAPFLHVEAYKFTAEDSEKYNKWFTDYSSDVFLPLLMNQAGLKGYDYFKYVGLSINYEKLIEKDYPTYVSVNYFEDIKDFENFENSKELAACKKTLRSIFPNGLRYQWYVQYHLVKSWSK